MSKPSSFSPACIRRVTRHRFSRRSGSRRITSSAASTVATEAGGMLALKISARAWWRR